MASIIGMAIFGAFCGLVLLNVLALIAKNGKNQFDYVEFASDKDVYAMVDAWAASNGYVLKRSEGDERKYQKGSGFLTAPMFLELNRVGGKYSIKSYVRISGLILHGDVGLGGDGFLVKLPRSIAKKAQNQLFQSLELQPLQ